MRNGLRFSNISMSRSRPASVRFGSQAERNSAAHSAVSMANSFYTDGRLSGIAGCSHEKTEILYPIKARVSPFSPRDGVRRIGGGGWDEKTPPSAKAERRGRN